MTSRLYDEAVTVPPHHTLAGPRSGERKMLPTPRVPEPPVFPLLRAMHKGDK